MNILVCPPKPECDPNSCNVQSTSNYHVLQKLLLWFSAPLFVIATTYQPYIYIKFLTLWLKLEFNIDNLCHMSLQVRISCDYDLDATVKNIQRCKMHGKKKGGGTGGHKHRKNKLTFVYKTIKIQNVKKAWLKVWFVFCIMSYLKSSK